MSLFLISPSCCGGLFRYKKRLVGRRTGFLLLFDFLSLKNYVNDMYRYLQKVISRKTFLKLVFCWCLECQWRKKQDPDRSISQSHGSADLDPDPLMDPQHWFVRYVFAVTQLTLFERKKYRNGTLDSRRLPRSIISSCTLSAQCTHHEDTRLIHHVEEAPGYRALLTQQMLEMWTVFCLRKS